MVELGDPGPGKPRDDAPPRRRRGRRWAVASLGAVAILVALTLVALLFLTRTDRGASIVVGEVLERLPLRGEITVEGVRTEGLLEGVRLYGVSITGPRGRTFLTADSMVLAYDWRTLLGGAVVFDRLHIYQPDVLLTRYPGEDDFNVQRIFVSEEEAADTATGPAPPVVFEDVRIVGGDVRVLFPQEGEAAERVVTIPVPGAVEGRLRRLTFHDVSAVLPRVVLSSPQVTGQLVVVDSLSTSAGIYEDPLALRRFSGRLTYDAGRLDVDADVLVLEGSRAEGSVYVQIPSGDGPLRFGFALESEGVELSDLRWIDPRIPAGTARGGFALDAMGDSLIWTLADARVASQGSTLDLDGTLVMGSGESVAFRDLDVRASPLALAQLEPWLDEPLPVEGSVSGVVALDGTLDRLRAEGSLTLRRPGSGPPATTAEFNGVLHLDEGFGFTDLQATFDPFDFGLVSELTALELGGAGRVVVEATGDLSDAIRFTAEVDHRVEGAPDSHVRARGSVRRAEDTYVIDVQADLSPLSFTALRRWHPDLPVTGEVSGSLRAAGPLTELSLTTDLETEAGRLALDVQLDATDPGAYYSAEGEVSDFRLSRLVPSLPEPTVISGRVDIEGRGLDAATAAVDARLHLRAGSRVGGLILDTAAVALRVADGVLHVDTLDAVVGGVDVQGQGTLALEAGAPAGTVSIAFQADSLAGLRPLLFGDSILVRDELSPLERQVLAAAGIDADTLPSSREVRVGGSVAGEVTLTGSVSDFSAEGEADLERVAYGANTVVQDVSLTFSGTHLPGLEGDLHATLLADSLVVFGREFAGADVEVDYTRPQGSVSILLQRHEDEDYRARASFRVDTLGAEVVIEELALRFDTLTWRLDGPTTVALTDAGLRVENLTLVRPGEEPLRIEAEGVLPTEGQADFHLEIENMHLARLARLAQVEELGVGGVVDLSLDVRGSASSPVISGTLSADSVGYEAFELSRVEAEVDYASRSLAIDLVAWSDSLRVLRAQGTIPVDLALQDVADRFPDRAMDLRVSADSLPAAFVLAPIPVLSDVQGTVSGTFRIAGTVDAPEPSGAVAVNDASFLVPSLGVRYEDVTAALTLREDAIVEVDALAHAGGEARVTGTVSLEPLDNPTFDLDIALSEFRASDRADVEGTISGLLHLSETYDSPLVTGDVVVDEGVLYLEEFIRASTVVDLSDPRYFTVIDTTLFSGRPAFESENPFLRNLRVSVDMEVAQDTWLRSDDLNVEIGGELIVTYDRGDRKIVLVGDLEARRGSYTILGRSFEVQEGTVEFVGTPGINPNLNIQAVTQVRQLQGQPISIVATVSGTLEDPVVELSSDEAALSQSDLVSYLIFGRPTFALASGQAQIVEGAAGSLLGAGVGATASILSGTVANRLSALLAQQWGFLDYFAITQVGDLGLGGRGASGLGVFSETVLELGSYVGQDLFFTLLLQPFSRSGDQIAGARLEWRIDNYWSLEAFVEERFLRGPFLGFQEQLGYETSKVVGMFIFWERGY